MSEKSKEHLDRISASLANTYDPFNNGIFIVQRIAKLVNEYETIVLKPKYFLARYFDELVAQIDLEVEQLIIQLQGDNSKQVYPALSKSCQIKNEAEYLTFGEVCTIANQFIDELNKIRENMIKIVRTNERYILEKIDQDSTLSLSIEDYRSTLDKHKSSILQLSINGPVEVEKLLETRNALDHDLYRLKRLVFQNKSIFYVKNVNDFQTKILTIQEEVDVEYLKRNNYDFYLKKKVPRTEPKDIGHLILIENLFLNDQEIDLFSILILRYLSSHYKYDYYFTEEYLYLKKTNRYYRYLKDMENIQRRYNCQPHQDVCNIYNVYRFDTVCREIREQPFSSYQDSNPPQTKKEVDANMILIVNMVNQCELSNEKIRCFDANRIDLSDELYINKCDVDSIKSTAFQKVSFTSLRKLDLSANQIQQLEPGSFDSLVYLRDLNLSKNRLESIHAGLFENLTNLEVLDLSVNKIRSLNTFSLDSCYQQKSVFIGLSKLVKLDLSFNQLQVIFSNQFSNFGSLEYLMLNGNRLKGLKVDSFSGLNNLKELNLASNSIKFLGSLYFSSLGKLQNLDLSRNLLPCIKSNTFSRLPLLRRLKLDMNKLSQLKNYQFSNLVNLEELDLSMNKIKQISNNTFNGLANLIQLNLQNNELVEFKSPWLAQLGSLTSLNLKHNLIQYIEPGSLSNSYMLNYLDLRSNQLEILLTDSFQGLNKLEGLYLNWNHLTTLQMGCFNGLSNLKILNLSFNELHALVDFQFKGLSLLEELYLNNNLLSSIEIGSFWDLAMLKKLSLNVNRLGVINRNRFLTLTNLRELYLNDNG